MTIYIDESGGFIPSPVSRVCAVAALVLQDDAVASVGAEFQAWRSSCFPGAEVKGSSLSDEQTRFVLELLQRHDAIVELTALDVSHHSESQVRDFQRGDAAAFVRHLTPAHSQQARQYFRRLGARWMALSPQLALQIHTLILTIEGVIRHLPPYFAQRSPRELSAFRWVLDRKDRRLTESEQLWTEVVCPILQSQSVGRPAIRVVGDGFDYSAMERFRMPTPDYLRPHLPEPRYGSAHAFDTATDLSLLMKEHVQFADSQSLPGLQLADIVGSAFTKAMNSKLHHTAWRALGPLLLQREDDEPPVRFIQFGVSDATPDLSAYQTHVVYALKHRATRMLGR